MQGRRSRLEPAHDVKLDTLPVEMYIDYIRVFEKAP
jgi:hypothetical protein